MGLLLSGASHIYTFTQFFVVILRFFFSLSVYFVSIFSCALFRLDAIEPYVSLYQPKKKERKTLNKTANMMGTENEAHEYWLHIKRVFMSLFPYTHIYIIIC